MDGYVSSTGTGRLPNSIHRENEMKPKECFESFIKAGRRSCGGCNRERECGMLELNTAYLFGSFIPRVDPHRQTFAIPAETTEWAKKKLEEYDAAQR